MRLKVLSLALPLALFAGGASAEVADIEKINEILQNNACFACHQVDEKVVGRSYLEVAAQSSEDPGYADAWGQHIKEGSQSVWGAIPMPPTANVSDEDLPIIVDWIMAGARH